MPEAVTRPEFEAKLEALEARQDARADKLELRFERVEEKLTRVTSELEKLPGMLKEQRYWMVGTALATVIGLAAVIIAVWQVQFASIGEGRSQMQVQLEAIVRQPITDLSTKLDALGATVNSLEGRVESVSMPPKASEPAQTVPQEPSAP